MDNFFDSINKENFKNILVELIPSKNDIAGYITLKAKPGYTFNGIEEDSIRTKTPTDALWIRPILDITQQLINEAIIEYKNANNNDKIAALSKVFTGVNEDRFKLIKVYTTDNSFLLKTKKGYTFNGVEQDTITSLVENFQIIEIEYKPGITQQTIDSTIDKIVERNPNNFDLSYVLKDVFIMNISGWRFNEYLQVTIIEPTAYVLGSITLTAEHGYKILNNKILNNKILQNSITSAPLKPTRLKIVANPSHKEVIDYCIVKYNDAKTDDNKIWALSFLFKGINDITFKNITVQVIPSNNDIAGYITLKAKPGYTFNGVEADEESTQTSETIHIIIIKITIKTKD